MTNKKLVMILIVGNGIVLEWGCLHLFNFLAAFIGLCLIGLALFVVAKWPGNEAND